MRILCFEIEYIRNINWKRIARSGWDFRLPAIKAYQTNRKNKVTLQEAKIKVDNYMRKKGLMPKNYFGGQS